MSNSSISMQIVNSIIWGNKTAENSEPISYGTPTPIYRYSCLPIEVIDTNYTVNKIDRSKQLCEPENANYL